MCRPYLIGIKENPERSLSSSRRFVDKSFPRQNLLDGIVRNRQKVAKTATQAESHNSSQNQSTSNFLDKKDHKIINDRNGEFETYLKQI